MCPSCLHYSTALHFLLSLCLHSPQLSVFFSVKHTKTRLQLCATTLFEMPLKHLAAAAGIIKTICLLRSKHLCGLTASQQTDLQPAGLNDLSIGKVRLVGQTTSQTAFQTFRIAWIDASFCNFVVQQIKPCLYACKQCSLPQSRLCCTRYTSRMSHWSKVDFCCVAVMSAFPERLFFFVCLFGTSTLLPPAGQFQCRTQQRVQQSGNKSESTGRERRCWMSCWASKSTRCSVSA